MFLWPQCYCHDVIIYKVQCSRKRFYRPRPQINLRQSKLIAQGIHYVHQSSIICLCKENFVGLYSCDKDLGRNSQNFLKQICKIFGTFRCFYKAIIHRKSEIYVFYISNINFDLTK